jgi:pyruvate/2-oxoglutarate dehydrogenase complex dihydrolipoamide dehydrogenase (E3) component
MSHYDVIVIGSGAGGGTLVHRLAPSGKRVLAREPENWSAAAVFEGVARQELAGVR